ncbi:sterile alpha motif domain-containing protein 12-like isoform X2 [Lepisosteus oculatus]|uniref:sterile alpha motif domain-containing protein 12-like isoform X2 n=1 Tax=Lepisosteus oculatus TaxID=7918 RepID=UPI0035F5266D
MSKDTQKPTEVVGCKRVSFWTVEDVYEWVKGQYPCHQAAFLLAIENHAVSGRALLRISKNTLERMGVGPEQHPEILYGVLLLRLQEEVENLNDIVSAFAI